MNSQSDGSEGWRIFKICKQKEKNDMPSSHIFVFLFSLDCFRSCICCCWLFTNFVYAWVAQCPEFQEDLMKGFLVLGGWAQDEHGDYLLWPRQDCISWPSGWLGTRCGAQQSHHTGGPRKLGHFLHQAQWPRCYELRAGGVAHRSTAGHPCVHASTNCIAWRQDRDSNKGASQSRQPKGNRCFPSDICLTTLQFSSVHFLDFMLSWVRPHWKEFRLKVNSLWNHYICVVISIWLLSWRVLKEWCFKCEVADLNILEGGWWEVWEKCWYEELCFQVSVACLSTDTAGVCGDAHESRRQVLGYQEVCLCGVPSAIPGKLFYCDASKKYCKWLIS